MTIRVRFIGGPVDGGNCVVFAKPGEFVRIPATGEPATMTPVSQTMGKHAKFRCHVYRIDAEPTSCDYRAVYVTVA